MLENKDKDGNTINQEHIRLKGIPTSCMKYMAKLDQQAVLDLYEEL